MRFIILWSIEFRLEVFNITLLVESWIFSLKGHLEPRGWRRVLRTI